MCAARSPGFEAALIDAGSSSEQEDGSVLTGAEHPQYLHVTGGGVASGVRLYAVQGPIAAVAGQLSHARILPDPIEAWVMAQKPAVSLRRAAGPAPGWVSQPRIDWRSVSALSVWRSLRGTSPPSQRPE